MHFFLKYPKQNKETLIYLKYYISKEVGQFVYSTKTKIHPLDWNFEANQIKPKKGRKDLQLISSRIKPYNEHLLSLLTFYAINSIEVTKRQLKQDFDKKFKIEKRNNIPDFFQLIDEFTLLKKQANQLAKNTEKRHKNFKANLLRFQKFQNKKLTYSSFSKSHNFTEKWLSFCYNELNHVDNTVGRSMGFIKTILLYGHKKGYHNIDDLSHIKRFSQETDDIALTKEELLYYYHFDFSDNLYLEKVRDIFCIGCFTGQRFSDYSIFDKFDYKNGVIEKRAKKTKIKVIIPVDANEKLKYLLEKYNWQLPKISEQKFRDYLKESFRITGKLNYQIKKTNYQGSRTIEKIFYKWQMVGSHTARRTFISIALQNGWTYKEIMTVSGIKKVETVIKYDKVNAINLNKKVAKTF